MSSRPLLLVLWLLAVLTVAAPPAAHAQTALFLDSQPGDYIGRGIKRTYSQADGTFTATAALSQGVYEAGLVIKMTAPGSALVVSLKFEGTGPARVPRTGVYESARRVSRTPYNALDVSGFGRQCETLTGRFVVIEAEYGSAGEVLRFAADFEQHCEDNLPALFGAIRYNSTFGFMVPFSGAYPRYRLTFQPPLHGTVTGDGLTCGSDGSQCVANHASAATASVHATPDAGYIFAGWSQDCSGGPHSTVNINMQRTCSAAFVPLVPVQPRTLAVLMWNGEYSAQVRGSVFSPANSGWGLGSDEAGFVLVINPGVYPDWETFYIYPPTGQSFQAGVEYPTASSPDATHAGFSALGYTVGSYYCNGPGTMAVREWVANPGALPTRFSIDFQSCSGQLIGTIQYAGTYEYPRLDVNPRELHFKAVLDNWGIVSHSADQTFQIAQSGPAAVPWQLKPDQLWLRASAGMHTATTAVTATAKIVTGTTLFDTGTIAGHLQPFARGLINIPDPLTATLDITPADTTSRPFGVFRSASAAWFMPNQAALQFGEPGDIPLLGDFDGDGTSDLALYRPSTAQWFVQGQPGRQWGWPGDIPVPADYNGDGITDLAVFRQRGPSAEWFIYGESAPRSWGVRGDVPVPGDYDGDGVADLGVFRPSTGIWRILSSGTGQTVVQAVGQPGDVPVVADFNGDRRIDFAVFRPSTGFWYALTAFGPFSQQFGLPGDIPVPADVTGDGRAELRVWRPSTGMWYSYDRLLSTSANQQYGLPGDVPIMARPVLAGLRPDDVDGDRRADVTVYRPSTGEWFTRQSSPGYGTFTTQWGLDGDIPVPGDYDGDRRANPAVYRPSTGEWFVRRFNGTMLPRGWGMAGDVPVPADYDGDGWTDMAVYRPSSGEWFILTSASDYAAYRTFSWGLPDDRPMTGDFDGDGRADAAVYRPSTGAWFVALSSGGWFARQGGLPGDLPIARDFDGDGRADLAVYRPSTGEWFVLDAISGDHIFTKQWGLNGDVPVADDYDGDGVADVAVFRPATREWFVIRSSDGSVLQLQWGLAGDVPVTRR